jgi:putative pyruvate formate lyase activating enzyme
MWNLSKYDTLEALKMPVIRQTLPRYVSIIVNDMPARFRIAQRIVFDPKESMSTAQLWREHDALMHRFFETRSAIDKGKLELEELEVPRFSLLDLKIMLAESVLKSCGLCERMCKVDRMAGGIGSCKVSTVDECLISSEHIHRGEEPHIVPSHTIFFMGCNLHCQYCQNYGISQWKESGNLVQPEELAYMIKLRKRDTARNVNWVGGEPTPQIMCVLKTLRAVKTNTPQIWNSNFFMTTKSMKLLDGVVDMYLSDFKYGNNRCAAHLSKVDEYFEVVSRNHKLAAEQAELTVRHLVLPGHVECCTKPIFKWIAENIRERAVVNIMDQYRPLYRAHEYINLKRRITEEEMSESINYAKKLNLKFVA